MDGLGAGLGPDTTAAKSSGPGPAALFSGFFSIGISGFGGVLPWARRMVVERHGWLSPAEFTDLLALCQFLPGPNIINFSVALGSRFAGWPTGRWRLAGLMVAPMVIVVAARRVLRALRRCAGGGACFCRPCRGASGLVLATALKIAAPLRHGSDEHGGGGGDAGGGAFLRLPLLPCMLVLAPLSVAVLWRQS